MTITCIGELLIYISCSCFFCDLDGAILTFNHLLYILFRILRFCIVFKKVASPGVIATPISLNRVEKKS